MKKALFAIGCAVLMGFIAAVGLCVKTLQSLGVETAFQKGNNRIVLDAGHGGIDGGVSGCTSGVNESDINLAIVYRLKPLLEDLGFEIILTRKTEAGLYGAATDGFKKRDMAKRKEIIQEINPALVISIHQNRYPSKNVRGAQVFYRRGDQEGARFAEGVQQRLNGLYAEKKVNARKVVGADLFMLECTSSPSILVECGFLSSPQDDALLNTKAWQIEIAESIAGGVIDYFALAKT